MPDENMNNELLANLAKELAGHKFEMSDNASVQLEQMAEKVSAPVDEAIIDMSAAIEKASDEAEKIAQSVLADIASGGVERAHIGERYLRNRPFLVIVLSSRAKNGINTQKAGWNKILANVTNLETPTIVDRVSNKMMTEAAVIIDILNTKIVKNRNGSEHDDAVLKYYMERYSADIAEALQLWTSQLRKAAES